MVVCAGPFDMALLTVESERLLIAGDLEVCLWQLADFVMEFLMQAHWAWRWKMTLYFFGDISSFAAGFFPHLFLRCRILHRLALSLPL